MPATIAVSQISTSEDDQKQQSNPSIRPLHQNWWPIAFVNTLNKDAPNAERVLNKDLVLWHDGTEWRCMDDMCAHRYAPLSEGRVFTRDNADATNDKGTNSKRCLQCSYHGWVFDEQGICTRIPQAPDQGKALQSPTATGPAPIRVNSYPVRIGAGMIWVWTDRETSPFADAIPLPISPMLKQWERQYPQSAYQRDLPYGYELLGENVIDMAHLPFSHHNVLSDRDKAGVPLPLRMLSMEEKEQVWEKEITSVYANATDSAEDKVLPAYQVEIQKGLAQFTDPIIAINFMGKNEGDENSTSYLGFYPPSHIRYHRTPKSNLAGNTELFVCPQSAGRCRVLIFNPFEGGMERLQEKEEHAGDGKKKRMRLLSKLGNYLLRKVILSKFLGTNNHLLTSDVFDGDNIFLAQQGERLAKNGLDHTDYLAPTSADTLSFMFRRWLDRSADVTRKQPSSTNAVQIDNIVEAAGGVSSDGTSLYGTVSQMPRRELMDRYNSHTKDCPVCSKALAKLERRKNLLNYICQTLFGTTGASLVAAALSKQITDCRIVTGAAVKASLILLLLSALMEKIKRNTAKTIEKFYFVDHSHQD